MTTPVLHFTPRAELEPAANVQAFVDLCRQAEVLSARRQFDKNTLDIGYVKGHNKVVRAIFSTLEASSKNVAEPSLPQPFLDFAKAVLVYMQDQRPTTTQSTRLAALRCLEAGLRDLSKGARPTAVDAEVLDATVERAKAQVSHNTAYGIAGQLGATAELMRSKGFANLRERWTHGVTRLKMKSSRLSNESLTARQEKLPSAAVLRAIGGVFQSAVEPGDILVSSLTALRLCAPERINEVLRLRRNCLVEGDGDFRGKLGLRWAGSKGFPDTTKWLPSEMSPIAREAIANLVKVTDPAHRVAAWYTANPTKLYLHEDAIHLRDREMLTSSELGLILWSDATAVRAANDWAKRTIKLDKTALAGNRSGYRFEDLERVMLAMLPATFPYVPGDPGLLCKDALAVARLNELHPTRPTYWCMFKCVDYTAVRNQYGAAGDRLSVFERLRYTEDDGSPIVLRSHSLRHYLNMLAQTGGLSSVEIVLFSGRKDVRQNRAYDHMTSDEVQAPIGQALKDGFTSDLEPPASPSRNLVKRSELKSLGLAAAHTTEYGWCAHNFASEPCQMYRDCLNCEEQECIKGEEHKEANLRLQKVETEYLLKQASEALNDEEYGADIWVKHQLKTLERVNALLSILEDPTVPKGARIRLDLNNAPFITNDNVHHVKIVKLPRTKALA